MVGNRSGAYAGSAIRHLTGTRLSGKPTGLSVPKHRKRLSPETEKLITLFISAIEPVARLIDAITRIRLQTHGPLPGVVDRCWQGAISTMQG